MSRLPLIPILPVAMLAACGPAPAPEPSATPSPAPLAPPVADAATPPPPPHAGDPPKGTQEFIAAELIRQEWAKADNRAKCAAVTFTDDGGIGGIPRRAQFGGGWGVAFDTPKVRSAYGIAGPGLLEIDEQSPYQQTRRLMEQWPYFRELQATDRQSFAGYGRVGAEPYHASNLEGTGQHSLAYVRIYPETCTYNVWSRISRAHLETLLDGLRLMPLDEN